MKDSTGIIGEVFPRRPCVGEVRKLIYPGKKREYLIVLGKFYDTAIWPRNASLCYKVFYFGVKEISVLTEEALMYQTKVMS